ncbi:MAG TPA: AAA family ATPase, partial [Polyangiales bacterium]|nr:AAA family ATPase [Polyangiales bacterium]
MIYRFQDFELDEARLELRRSGVDIAIQARVLRALIYLVRHRDRVVLKDELCDAVWQDIVVSDAALAQVIMHVRKALGDEGEQQTLVKTVRGRGFRFIADVQELAPPAVATMPIAPARQPSPALVGRSCELQRLLLACDGALQGRGQCLLVAGEPGIGKSSLVEALASEANARGLAVLWGKAWEDGGAPPFWPFIQVLRALVERYGLEHLQRLSGPSWTELAALLAEALDGAEPAGPRAPAGESAKNRLRLFDALARLLRALCVGQAAVG